MKKTLCLVFVLIFAGLSIYFFFAEDYCHVHCCVPGGSLNHTHSQPTCSVCLCHWNTLLATHSFDFAFFQDVTRLAPPSTALGPLKPFNADIAHPPKSFLA